MTEEVKRSKAEFLKEGSRQLRGPIAEDLSSAEPCFSGDSEGLLKFHGVYQEDDRDLRKAKNPDGTPKGKTYIMMARTRIPGGRVTAEQFLTHLDLCEKYANGTLRITTRQGYQFHGIPKGDLKALVRGINDTLLTTLGACGDVNRNVMACPAPYKNNPVRDEMGKLAQETAEAFKPRSTAYFDIWLRDENGEETLASEFKPVEEPLYGTVYLPRKFKIAFALPEDNCVDIYANDLGFLAIVENDRIIGYNVLVGGGMGTTPSAAKTFPAVAKRMAFVTPDQVIPVAEAIIKVQRDNGNREDRKVARMKYVIANWGLEKFKATVEEYYGKLLAEPHPADVTDVDDHLGWHEQGDGKLFLGINIDCGRIQDVGDKRSKTGLRKVVEKYRMEIRNTAQQSMILCDIDPTDKADINRTLAEHGILPAEDLLPIRRLSMACVAFPTCGLSITDSERVYPQVMGGLEAELERQGLANERITMHMTGCPNGCARPYTPEIGIVGKAVGKYTIFLGGNLTGSRIAYKYKDMVPLEDLAKELSPALEKFKAERANGESFGDFCLRVGSVALGGLAE
jgi:sulfite reductase (ferredoxin)